MTQAERAKQRRARFKAAGICYICKKTSVTESTRCKDCSSKASSRVKKWKESHTSQYLAYHNQAQKARRNSFKEEGKCSKCGAEREDKDYLMCVECRRKTTKYVLEKYKESAAFREAQKKYEKARREKNKAKGLCCCGQPRKPGFQTCDRCFDRVAKSRPAPKYLTGEARKRPPKKRGEMTRTEVRRMWGALGLCRWCGKERVKDTLFCPDCLVTYEKSKANRRKKKK